jgi:hypothetical protein
LKLEKYHMLLDIQTLAFTKSPNEMPTSLITGIFRKYFLK